MPAFSRTLLSGVLARAEKQCLCHFLQIQRLWRQAAAQSAGIRQPQPNDWEA